MSEPLRPHPDSPGRFLWHGKPTFLLGSTEHYGAVLNSAFDYERYLDTIAADGLNLTRIFAFFRELEHSLGGQLGYANTLAPRPEHYLAPWARAADSSEVGPDGLRKFDLATWDERYFARLRAFLAAAAERGVVVELVLFCNPYDEEQWRHVPLNPASNVNGVGRAAKTCRDYLSLKDPSVVEQQLLFIRKVVAETNEFDNLYYEVCNEPTYHRDGDRAQPEPGLLADWQRELVRGLREAEAPLPKRHVVAVNPHMGLPARLDEQQTGVFISMLDDGFYRHDPRVDLLNVHYLSQREPRAGLHQLFQGGARFCGYHLGSIATYLALGRAGGKPVSFDEDYTGIVHGLTPRPAQNRLEAWESLVGGCAAYDHLDFTFTTDDPTGAAVGVIPGGLPPEWFDGRTLRRELGVLARCAADLDLASLRPDLLALQALPFNVGAVPARASDGARLAVYLADLRPFGGGFGESELGGTLALGGLPAGARYEVRTLNPQTGAWLDAPAATSDGNGGLRVCIPPFREDLVLVLDGRHQDVR